MTRPTGVLPKTLICQGCWAGFEPCIWAWARLFCVVWRADCHRRQERGGRFSGKCLDIPFPEAAGGRSQGIAHGITGLYRVRKWGPDYSYRTRRDRRRPDGIASTTRQSPIITIPMNSKAKASTAILLS